MKRTWDKREDVQKELVNVQDVNDDDCQIVGEYSGDATKTLQTGTTRNFGLRTDDPKRLILPRENRFKSEPEWIRKALNGLDEGDDSVSLIPLIVGGVAKILGGVPQREELARLTCLPPGSIDDMIYLLKVATHWLNLQSNNGHSGPTNNIETGMDSPDTAIIESVAGPSSKAAANDDVQMQENFSASTFSHSEEMMRILRDPFGLKTFKPMQLECINAAILGHDVMAILPTGGGKSLCFQLPGMMKKGVTVVVSPLISLMSDQVQKLTQLKIPTLNLSSDTNMWEREKALVRLSEEPKSYKFVYVTPEMLKQSQAFSRVLDRLHKVKMLSQFVVDEAHCISEWGHHFRFDYLALSSLRCRYPNVPITALTATATPAVQAEIVQVLRMRNTKVFTASTNRPNLKFSVVPQDPRTKTTDLVNLVTSRAGQSGIIFCFSRKDCGDLAEALRKKNVRVGSYHAGLTAEQRTKAQNDWMAEEIHVICATTCFGMGLDKPNVRFVIHFAMPSSLERLLQEVGRAGRDGERAECILFYSRPDIERNIKLMEGGIHRSGPVERTRIQKFNKMIAYCEDLVTCRRTLHTTYMGEESSSSVDCRANPNSAECDNCSRKCVYREMDVTKESKSVLEAVEELNAIVEEWTLRDIECFLMGFNSSKPLPDKFKKYGVCHLKMFGKGGRWSKTRGFPNLERLLAKLNVEEFLQMDAVKPRKYVQVYVRAGDKAHQLRCGEATVTLNVEDNGGDTTDLSSDEIWSDEDETPPPDFLPIDGPVFH